MFADSASKTFLHTDILSDILAVATWGLKTFCNQHQFSFFSFSYAPWFEMFYEVLNNISGADIRGEVSDFFTSLNFPLSFF